ncbi:MAG: type II toxin-antitoxin system RelE/ParE family toxin [Verrucomicrobiae bacterium]|nr:type II toxin-antitoxin system RelE/ParE family toxin [Verrucomicrobiae bacterium]
MALETIWTARAEADLLREFARLEDRAEGSGNSLLAMIDSGLRLVRVMPEMAPTYSTPFRRLVLKSPRFGVFYVVEGNRIVVHAVCDLRQDRASILRHLGMDR